MCQSCESTINKELRSCVHSNPSHATFVRQLDVYVRCGSEQNKGEEEGRSAAAAAAGEQTVIQRKIDTNIDQNAIENNEIEGSTKPASSEVSNYQKVV